MNIRDIHDRAMTLYRDWYPDLAGRPNGGGCLYIMQVTLKACLDLKVAARPVAGSAHWRMNDLPYPQSNTFSYVWSPERLESIRAVKSGGLPEMHCWIEVRQTGGVLDCSLAQVYRHALALGHKWTLPQLPPFIHGPYHGPGYIYEPIKEATEFAIDALKCGIEGKELPKLSAWASQ